MRWDLGDPVVFHRSSGMSISGAFRYMLTDDSPSHWKTDQVISVDTHTDVPDPRHHTTRFHRGHLHAALLEHVPRNIIHLNKRVKRAEATHHGVSLHFEDGSSAHGHVLIGADGIRSVSCDWLRSV